MWSLTFWYYLSSWKKKNSRGIVFKAIWYFDWNHWCMIVESYELYREDFLYQLRTCFLVGGRLEDRIRVSETLTRRFWLPCFYLFAWCLFSRQTWIKLEKIWQIYAFPTWWTNRNKKSWPFHFQTIFFSHLPDEITDYHSIIL